MKKTVDNFFESPYCDCVKFLEECDDNGQVKKFRQLFPSSRYRLARRCASDFAKHLSSTPSSRKGWRRFFFSTFTDHFFGSDISCQGANVDPVDNASNTDHQTTGSLIKDKPASLKRPLKRGQMLQSCQRNDRAFRWLRLCSKVAQHAIRSSDFERLFNVEQTFNEFVLRFH